ncbi:MAG TPA: cation/H(+) antiporter [Rhodospirillaceae bacterium]|nr:cation/H(+) antiporter [Rhodospirillaceae bacterium]
MHSSTELGDLAIILAAAFIGGALLRQLRQPVLVGYILVGAVFGPTGLGLAADVEGIRWLAELGILLLMFYIGLELDLTHFRVVAKPAIITTAVQIFGGIGVMYVISHFTAWPIKTVILLGCCVALSSTAVAIKILDEMGLKQSFGGQTSMGILIAQDISIVPMMLILGAMDAGGTFDIMGLVKLAIGLMILFLVLWISVKQPKWFMRWGRYLAKIKSRAMKDQTAITALAICFAGAALAGAYGLSAAYGAFLAGLALGRTKNREKFQNRIQSIFDVLMMVFFLSVGLLIDLNFVMEHLVVVVILVSAALVLKTIINVVTLRLQGMTPTHANLAGAVTGQIGEFSFLLAATGLSDRSLDVEAYKYAVAVISLSLVFTPLWLAFLRRMKFIPALAAMPGEDMEKAARSVI